MPEDSLLRRLKRAAEEPFSGWDFSRLRGRMVEEPVSWSYEEIVRAHLPAARSLLDMDTGGGELLIREFQPLPLQTTATEGYPPNVSIARARLAPIV